MVSITRIIFLLWPSGRLRAIAFFTIVGAITACDVTAPNPSHQGPCARSSCQHYGLTIYGFVPLNRTDLDPSVEFTLCRNGQCLMPVDYGTMSNFALTQGNVSYEVAFYERGGACFGLGPLEQTAGACILVNHDETAFPLNDGDAYTLSVVGKTNSRVYVEPKDMTAHYIEDHPPGCEHPEAILCRHSELMF